MSDSKQVRLKVADAYARALQGGGCCSIADPKGVAAKVAGYDSPEVATLPQDAVANSFGCGNPVAFGEVREGEVVLDLGSGAGLDLLLAAKKVGPSGRVIGVDMTEAMIERAEANIAAAGLRNVEVRQGIIEDLPVEPASVDWVISNCVINLSPEKEKAFAEIARVLKPGGRMVVSDIVVKDLPQWARQSSAIYDSCVGGAISEEAYLEGLRAAGLEEVEVRSRIVYEASQITALIESECADGAEGSCCCGGSTPEAELEGKLAELEGKIWSATFVARKPLM